MNEPKDEEFNLIQRARKGDKDAFEVLVKRYQNYIYNFAYNLCGGNRAEADDLAQMTFIRAFRAIHDFEGRSKLKTWLHRITINLWKNMVRSQKRRQYFHHQSINETSPDENSGHLLELKDKGLGPLDMAERDETSDLVREAINQLPPDEREVTVLRDIEGYAYEEIAKICKIPLGTVKSRLSRARRMLRASLEPVLRR